MFGVLTPTRHKKKPSGQFYFVSHSPGISESVRNEGDNVAVIESKANESFEEEFRPKPVNRNLVSCVLLFCIVFVLNQMYCDAPKTEWTIQ